MKIIITYGVGEGNTEISAFDSALLDAGINNYNLIKLSSVIPPESIVKVKKINFNLGKPGERLYVVISERGEKTKGKEAWAGLGWVLGKNNKTGVFVESQASSSKKLENLIEKTLKDLKKNRNLREKKSYKKIIGIKCKNKPVCAVVCAVFKSEKW